MALMKHINLTLTEKEYKAVLSSLLFACSVNVVSETNEEFQRTVFECAKKVKQQHPNVTLEDIRFIEEDCYEEQISDELLTEFKSNLSTISFDNV
jgi:hypothetical protein